MTRALFGETLFFFLPFLAFAFYLIVRRRNPFVLHAWSDKSLWLAIAGLACVVIALLITGLTADRQMGAFRPTHVENGRVVPGQFQ
jgi:magnesium-transporting ATPase (P-type)